MANSDFQLGGTGAFIVLVALALIICAVYVEIAVMNQW